MTVQHLLVRVQATCASFSCDNLVETTIPNAGRTYCPYCRREAKLVEDSKRVRKRSRGGAKKRGRASRLTPEQVQEMRRLHPDLTLEEIARLFCVSKSYASRIIRGVVPEKFADVA